MFPLGKASESLCSTANQPLAIWRITRHLLLFFFLLVVFCFHDTLNHLSLLLSETWVRASLVQSNILGLAGCNAGLNIELPVLVKELETEIKPWSKASWNQWDFFHQLQCYREENFQLALWWDHFGWPHVLSSSIKAARRVCKAQRRLCVRLCNQETGGCQVPLLSPAFFFLHNFIQVEHRERDFLHLPLPGQKLGMDFLLPGDIRAPHCPQPGPAGSFPASHGCVLPTRHTLSTSPTLPIPPYSLFHAGCVCLIWFLFYSFNF